MEKYEAAKELLLEGRGEHGDVIKVISQLKKARAVQVSSNASQRRKLTLNTKVALRNPHKNGMPPSLYSYIATIIKYSRFAEHSCGCVFDMVSC